MTTDMNAFRRALAAVGGQRAMARCLTSFTGERFTQSRVSGWVGRRHIPEKLVPLVARVSGVPAGELSSVFRALDQRDVA